MLHEAPESIAILTGGTGVRIRTKRARWSWESIVTLVLRPKGGLMSVFLLSLSPSLPANSFGALGYARGFCPKGLGVDPQILFTSRPC